MTVHPFEPVFDENSEILILGSFPSVKSREQHFFYGHPRNRFWKVLAAVFDSDTPQTIYEKKAFLLKNHIALWDVIASCDVEGSADCSIKNVVPNDLSVILQTAKIKQIFVNGKTAEKYYNKYQRSAIGKTAVCLPSTSPANAAYGIDNLITEWSKIKKLPHLKATTYKL